VEEPQDARLERLDLIGGREALRGVERDDRQTIVVLRWDPRGIVVMVCGGGGAMLKQFLLDADRSL